MSTIEERLALLEREHTELKVRVATLDGSFQFVTGQLRDLQTYMHDRFVQVDRRFDQVDKRFDQVDQRFDRIENELKALPRAIAEIIRETRS